MNNSCKNCNFYRPHYAKDDDGRLYELPTGHCTNKKVGKMQFHRGMKAGTACLKWEASKEVELKESIDDVIKNMATRIEQIAKHLNIDC